MEERELWAVPRAADLPGMQDKMLDFLLGIMGEKRHSVPPFAAWQALLSLPTGVVWIPGIQDLQLATTDDPELCDMRARKLFLPWPLQFCHFYDYSLYEFWIRHVWLLNTWGFGEGEIAVFCDYIFCFLSEHFGLENFIMRVMYKECCGKCGMKAALPCSWMNWLWWVSKVSS